jgi:Family of unknown function (DUF6130)
MRAFPLFAFTLGICLIAPIVHAQEPAAHLVAEPPVPGLLASGLVVIRFRTENLKVVPVYGQAALGVTPRIGHLHITIDDASWHWVHASVEPVVIQGLGVGPHKVLLELADPTHKVIEGQSVSFTIADKPTPAAKP